MSLNMTLYPLLSTGLTQEDRKSSRQYLKIVDWDAKPQHEQNQEILVLIAFSHSHPLTMHGQLQSKPVKQKYCIKLDYFFYPSV